MKNTIFNTPIKKNLGQTDNIPTEEPIVIKIIDKKYGRKKNILVKCKIENTNIEFTFSVWHNNGYMPRSGGVCFKSNEVLGKKIDAVFKQTKSGLLDIVSAKYSQKEKLIL